jgi:hypothetical protein
MSTAFEESLRSEYPRPPKGGVRYLNLYYMIRRFQDVCTVTF